MFKMTTCGRARKLMPLFAAGDLAGRSARRVAAHVERCESCRRLAREFAESREWARAASEPPEFGADFYEQLRGNVLAEIKRDRRPSAPRRAPLFASPSFAANGGRRLAYAASLALAALACALALNFYLRRATDDAPPSPLAHTSAPAARDAATTGARDAASPEPARTPQPGHGSRPAHASQPAHDAPAPGATQPREGVRRDAQPKSQTAAGNPRRALTLQASAREAAARERTPIVGPSRRALRGFDGERVPVVPGRVPVTEATPSQSGEVARIEIQTADPNIRIIWLASQKADEIEPKR